jgi:hypothetical protein
MNENVSLVKSIPKGEKKMQEKILKDIKDLLNEGYSIFGELDESVKRMEDLREYVKKLPAPEIFNLNAFEVHSKTKNHETPYVTMVIDGELVSGYATAIGNKLAKIARKYGEGENNHFYMKEVNLPIQFLISESENGEYLDLKAV